MHLTTSNRRVLHTKCRRYEKRSYRRTYMKSSSRLSRLKMSNRIPFISSKKRPGEQGDIDDVKCNHNIVLSSRVVMATPDQSSPSPPPPPRTKPPAPSTPPPSSTPPSRRSSPELATADKAVQSTMQSANVPVRRAEFARTVHTFFNEQQSHTDNTASTETTINGSVQTATLVHTDDPEEVFRSFAMPLALAAPCRSKPPRCSPSSSFDGRELGSSNEHIGRDANSGVSSSGPCGPHTGAGGDGDASSVAVAMSSAGSSSPCSEPEDSTGEMRSSSRIDDQSPEENCMESCVYYSVRCCECVVQ